MTCERNTVQAVLKKKSIATYVCMLNFENLGQIILSVFYSLKGSLMA